MTKKAQRKEFYDEKPVVLLLSDRHDYFSREFLRGVVSASREYGEWGVWALPVIQEVKQLEECL